VKTARDESMCLRILEAVEAVNHDQKHRMFQKLNVALGGSVAGARVAVWGLAFKPNTDDMRDAPALALIEELLAGGATVVAHDPVAMDEAVRRLGSRVEFATSGYQAATGADALAVVTDWNEYRHPDFARIKQVLKRPIIIDGRNLYPMNRMAEMGFKYYSIGRRAIA
jgi:UDPglucose 6-dehydrogenase